MCVFAGGFTISSNCDKNSESISNLENVFELTEGKEHYINESFSYLSGSRKFRVIEIEIYEVKWITTTDDYQNHIPRFIF